MDRLVQRNVLATSGRAVEAAGDVDTLLLDKTGTITFGNRRATALHPGARRSTWRSCAAAARLSSLADQTPEGRSIVELVRARARPARRGDPRRGGRRVRPVHRADPDVRARRSRRQREVRKGAGSAVAAWLGHRPADGQVARKPDAPTARGHRVSTRDRRRQRSAAHPAGRRREGHGTGRRRHARARRRRAVRRGQARHAPSGSRELRAMGIRTVMITGDNPLTAKAIAAEAGRGRLPRRGHARGQDGADPPRAGGRAAGRDDRRRHQRRARRWPRPTSASR